MSIKRKKLVDNSRLSRAETIEKKDKNKSIQEVKKGMDRKKLNLIGIIVIGLLIGTGISLYAVIVHPYEAEQITTIVTPTPTPTPTPTLVEEIKPKLPDLQPAFGYDSHWAGGYDQDRQEWTHKYYKFGLVRNYGEDCNQSFSVGVLFTYHTDYQPKLIEKRFNGLSGGEKGEMEITFPIEEWERLEYAYAVVDIRDEVVESNENNNGDFGVKYLAMLTKGLPESYPAHVPEDIQKIIREKTKLV